ncbi:TetR/AcrR family transcriptional regulator [Brucella sp. BE17]|uniref:TetR/AcrR family transcriptional regulator n=1 Tax=Brucella sp. BE17 TaxID=3142977 RepID=UPI0031BB5C93
MINRISVEKAEKKPRKVERQTQAQRSSNTQEKICNATLEVLAEVGHNCISTALIAKKAKVSRGALTHQYASRNDLLVAALRRLHNDWSQLRPFTEDSRKESYSLSRLIEELWDNLFSDKRYIASLELMLAARLDTDLGVRLREEMVRWVKMRDDFILNLQFSAKEPRLTDQHVHLLMASLRGIAMYQIFDKDMQAGKNLVELYKSIIENNNMSDSEENSYSIVVSE